MRALRRVGERAERDLFVFILTQIAKKPVERKRKRKRAAIEEDQEEEEMENGMSKATCSVSSFNAYKSAIKDLYTEQGVAMKDELNRELRSVYRSLMADLYVLNEDNSSNTLGGTYVAPFLDLVIMPNVHVTEKKGDVRRLMKILNYQKQLESS